MKYLIVFVSFLFAVSAPAQNCDTELLLRKKGTWKESSAAVQGIAAADLARQKKIVAAINKMIRLKYAPMGVNVHSNGGYSRTQPNMPANDYTYSIIPLNLYCDGNTIKTAHETSSYFSVSANRFDAEIYESPKNNEATSGLGFHYIVDMPVETDGCWHFKEKDVSLGFGMTGKSRAWLITYNGLLPYAYVTKKEFLETRKIILTNAMLMSASGFKDVLKRIEIEKGYKETEYKNEPEKLKRYMKMDYSDTKARYEKLIAENEKNYRPAFEKIETQLKISATELNQQAIVKEDPNDHLSYLFTDDNDPFGKILIKPNPGYFNKKLAKSSPQFFWVYERGNQKEPVAAKFMADIIQAVDFTTLKNMLGK